MKHGATTIFPTLSSSPKESICKAVSICEKLMAEKDGPVLGLHVEGPYLNAKMAGNLYDVKNPDKEEYMSILESTNCIKRWDASPELRMISPVISGRKVFWLPLRIRKPNSRISKKPMRQVLPMRHSSTTQCPVSTSVVNINTKERWKVFS